MAIKTKTQLQLDNDTIITTNSNRQITGELLNGLVEDIIDSYQNIGSTGGGYITIGTGGDYPANDITDGLKAALDDGYYNFLILSDFTVFGDLDDQGDNVIYLKSKDEQRTINLSVANTEILTIVADNVHFSVTGANSIFWAGTTFYLKNSCQITGDDASLTKFISNIASSTGGIYADKLTINMGDYGMWAKCVDIIDLTIVGNGTHWGSEGISFYGVVNKLTTSGTFPTYTSTTSQHPIQLFGGIIERKYGVAVAVNFRGKGEIRYANEIYVSIRETNVATLRNCNISKLGWYQNSYIVNEITNCTIGVIKNLFVPANDTINFIKICRNNSFTNGDVTLNQNDQIIEDCEVTTGTFIVPATVSNARIEGSTTLTTISNVGTDTKLLNNIGTDSLLQENLKLSGILKLGQFTHTEAAALTPAAGDFIYVTSTAATFTSIGFWGYENSTWVKL